MSRNPQSQTQTMGTLITHLVHVLALNKQWSKSFTTDHIATSAGFGPDIVYKWRQDRVMPSEETVTTLLRLGHEEAKLEREWGVNLIRASRYFELMDLIDEIWEPDVEHTIPHNLPKPTYTEFVGRQCEQSRLLELLGTTSAAPLIMVNGIGGVGKTSLVMKVAYQCLDASCRSTEFSSTPTFAVIIFVSAKQKYLTADGILPRAYPPDTLRAIYREIAYVLDLDLTQLTHEEVPSRIHHALSRQRTLLIVDNLETVEDKESVLAFLYDLPAQVKVVITTREQHYYTPIQLSALSEKEGLVLIEQEAAKQQLSLAPADFHQLYKGTGGIPAAIIYGVGQLAAGRDLSNVLMRMADHGGDVARFFFRDSVAPLRGTPAHYLLMAIALFRNSPQAAVAFHVAGLADDAWQANEAEVRLLRLSLIHKEQQQFVMHPLTREYTLAELSTHLEFERAARERWIGAYAQLVTEVGKELWSDWKDQYQSIHDEWTNLDAVIQWCMQQQRYKDCLHFWQQLGDYTLTYGLMVERLQLAGWITEYAERQREHQVRVRGLYEQAISLLLLGGAEELQKAEKFLVEAWICQQEVTDELRVDIAIACAELYLRRKAYREGLSWLEIADECLEQLAESDSELHAHKVLDVEHGRARLLLATEEMTKAHVLATDIHRRAKEIGASRLYYDIQHTLAEIALVLDDLITAETLLLDGVRIVERNRDQRRTAQYKRTLALLAQKRTQLQDVNRWIHEACTLFDTLGLHSDAQATSALLKDAL